MEKIRPFVDRLTRNQNFWEVHSDLSIQNWGVWFEGYYTNSEVKAIRATIANAMHFYEQEFGSSLVTHPVLANNAIKWIIYNEDLVNLIEIKTPKDLKKEVVDREKINIKYAGSDECEGGNSYFIDCNSHFF